MSRSTRVRLVAMFLIACVVPRLHGAEPPVLHPALDAKVSIDLKGRPFYEAVAELAKQSGARIELDTKSLTDIGFTADRPLTCPLNNISLRSALRIMLRDHDLAFVLKNEYLVVTTPDEASKVHFTKVHYVGDLLPPRSSGEPRDFDSLIDLVTSIVRPTSWDNVGGAGTITGLGDTLIFSQTFDVHEETAALLTALRTVRKLEIPKSGGDAVQVGDRPEHAAIRKALDQIASLDFSNRPLSDCLASLWQTHGVQVVLDKRGLNDMGVKPDQAVTFRTAGVSLGSALQLMLRPLDLTYVIDDEVLWITTPEEATKRYVIRVYNVRDLVTSRTERGGEAAHYDPLIVAIKSTVRTSTWDEMGGAGSIRGFEPATALVCSQTADVQDEIAQLIGDLRMTRAAQDDPAAPDRGLGPPAPPEYVVRTYFLELPGKAEDGVTLDKSVQELITVVKDLTSPKNWTGSEPYIRNVGTALVVRQTPETHRRVGRLLRTLRFLSDAKAPVAGERVPSGVHGGTF